jgi:sugar lactone lactonase YvrE
MLQGLLKYDYSTGDVTLLATHVSKNSSIDPDTPITYANDLAIAHDGTIYFTSCTGQLCCQLGAGSASCPQQCHCHFDVSL